MSVLVIGGSGNMGSRYRAILKHLGVTYESVDLETSVKMLPSKILPHDGAIICTPTATHLEIIDQLKSSGKRILCEKPISTDIAALGCMVNDLKAAHTSLSMIYQYGELAEPGKGYYDYFKHGADGLIWDCLQIIALSNGNCVLKEESPFWVCSIGGKTLQLSDMDGAYVSFIQKWLNGSVNHDLDWLFDVHLEAFRQQRRYERPISSYDWHSGAKH